MSPAKRKLDRRLGWSLAAVLWLLILCPGQALADGTQEPSPSLTGVWEGSYLMSSQVIYLDQQGGNLSGVAYITDPFGHTDTYHVKGTVHDGVVEGFHHSGHRFKGALQPDGQVRGTLTTAKGAVLHIAIHRRAASN